jgi:hypothetical protein
MLDGFYTILDIVGRTEWRLWLRYLSSILDCLFIFYIWLYGWAGWFLYHPGYCGEDRVEVMVKILLNYCGLSLYLLHLVVWLGWMVFIPS